MMKRLICAVLIFVMVFSNAYVCHAEEHTNEEDVINTGVYTSRATGHLSFSVKSQGSHYIESMLSLEAGDTVRINATYSPGSASIYVGLIDQDGVFHYLNVSNGDINATFEIEESGEYKLAVMNNSAHKVNISGYVYY